MPRKGWSTVEVPDGWLQVIRGPRPPAVRWPKAPRGRGLDSSTKKDAKGSSQPPQPAQRPVPEVRRGPPQVSPVAQERVVRLQTAVDALGDDNSPEAKMLRDALKKAQQEATLAPVGVRLDACAQFVERARNRLSRANEELRKAQDERVRLEQELRDGEQRLEALRVEASEQRTPASGRGDEVSQMQKLVTELNQIAAERDALSQELRRSRAPKARSWCGDGPPDLSDIPPLPDDRQAIEEWMNARNCDLRDALEFGSADVVTQVSNMLAQGASKMLTLSRVSTVALQGQAMDVQTSLGNRMCAVIDAADAKRRCLDGGH